MTEESDEALVAAVRDGSERAFNELVDRHQQAVRTFLRGITAYDDADDLAQETFLAVWTHARSYRGGHVRAWLFSIGLDWSAADQVSPAVMREARRWQDAFYATMREHCGIAAYQNFPDPSLVDWRQAYYGANLPKLQRIKAAVDPSNLFRHEQSL